MSCFMSLEMFGWVIFFMGIGGTDLGFEIMVLIVIENFIRENFIVEEWWDLIVVVRSGDLIIRW